MNNSLESRFLYKEIKNKQSNAKQHDFVFMNIVILAYVAAAKRACHSPTTPPLNTGTANSSLIPTLRSTPMSPH